MYGVSQTKYCRALEDQTDPISLHFSDVMTSQITKKTNILQFDQQLFPDNNTVSKLDESTETPTS